MGTPKDTDTTTTPTVTTKPNQCVYNQFVYEPGQMIGIVLVREDCFLVHGDKDSEIKKKSVDCPSTTRPDTSTVSDIFITTINDNVNTTTPIVVSTTEIVEKQCEWNHLQFTPGQIIGTVNSDGTCFMVYCDENSEIVNKTVECTSTTTPEVTSEEVVTTTTGEVVTTTTGEVVKTTTEEVVRTTTGKVVTTTTGEVVTVTPRQVTPSVCEWKNFVYGPGDVIGIVVVESGCVLVYCDLDSNIANKTVNCPTTASSTSTSPVVTTETTKYCQYNNFQYMPGQEVGKVVFQGKCYVVYCDSNSKIVKKAVQCDTTPTPEVTDTTSTPEDTENTTTPIYIDTTTTPIV